MAARAARAKAESSTNKSQAIRDTVVELGKKSRPRDVIANLKEKGIEVSAALVTNVMSRESKRRPRRKTSVAAVTGRKTAGGGLSIESLMAAKQFVDQVGSIAKAKQALDALAKLL